MQVRTDQAIYDNTAFGELYQRHAQVLLAYIRRHVSTREDAEDILLEVFLAALERDSLGSIKEGEQLAWLHRVAHNKCIDLYRRTQQRLSFSLESVAEVVYEDEEQTPEQVALRVEEHALLRRHLARLSAQQQAVLRLRFAHDLHSPEIARQLSKSESGVRMLLARGLNRLRQLYRTQPEQGNGQDE